ncbi:YARHG domain-containing protein [Zavarzinia sp.]|uniref:YARHG domain-containing protein n=1 Tax=Zavarzinia sp. TaxID=2027920 RepID=UPI003563F8AE
MTITDALTAISVLIAGSALGFSYFTYRSALRASSRPVLVFVMQDLYQWELRNIGNGPATVVKIRDSGVKIEQYQITNCFPISAGAATNLSWLRYGWKLSAQYKDVFGRTFVTNCNNCVNKIERDNGGIWRSTAEEWDQRMGRVKDRLINDMAGKTAWELDIMRNEIFARHGYIFKRNDLSDYFSNQPWYRPNKSFLSYNEMTHEEKYIANVILQYQNKNNLRLM